MSNEHSPGPWKWEPKEPDGQMPALMSAEGKYVCEFGHDASSTGGYYPTEGSPPDEADARLIAAAPELLAALERALDTAESCTPSRKPIDDGRALIARVKGTP
jgi:hypothetical protein